MDQAAKADNKVKTPKERLIEALSAPLPVTDLDVSAEANYLETAGDDKQVSLTVYFEGDRFQYREPGQRNAFNLEILYVIYDASGKQVDGILANVEGNLSGERLQQAKSSGYRFSQRVSLKPGVYQVRIGVREEGSERLGTASAWVEVPTIAPAKLEMSSLIIRNPLTSDPVAKEGMDVGKLEQVRIVQGIPLYGRGDFCDYAFRVFEGGPNPAGSELAWMKEVLKDGKPVIQEPWRAIDEEDREKDSKGWFDLDGDVELSGLSPGVYELRVSVKNALSSSLVRRTAIFGVE